MATKQIPVALSAGQKMEKTIRDKLADIEQLKEEAIIARDKLRALWSALRMIRDCVEELGPLAPCLRRKASCPSLTTKPRRSSRVSRQSPLRDGMTALMNWSTRPARR